MPCDYPVFLDLTGRLAVVVGAGEVAARKVEKLLSAGACVRVVAPSVCPRIGSLLAAESAESKRFEIVRSSFVPAFLDGAFLVFACTDDEEVNRAVSAAARQLGALINRADEPGDCDFFVPAASRQGAVTLAVSTGGASPAMASRIRQWLDDHFPGELRDLAEELARLRPIVRQRLSRATDRAALWRTLCSDESARLLAEHGRAAWRAWCEQAIAQYSS